MRKRLITPTPETIPTRGGDWLDLERVAVVVEHPRAACQPREFRRKSRFDRKTLGFRRDFETARCGLG